MLIEYKGETVHSAVLPEPPRVELSRPTEQVRALEHIKRYAPLDHEAIAKGRAPTLYHLDDYTRSGNGGYVRIFAIGEVQETHALIELTGAIHKACGIACKERGGRYWLYLRATGTSRAQEVAEAIARAQGAPADRAHSCFYLHAL